MWAAVSRHSSLLLEFPVTNKHFMLAVETAYQRRTTGTRSPVPPFITPYAICLLEQRSIYQPTDPLCAQQE